MHKTRSHHIRLITLRRVTPTHTAYNNQRINANRQRLTHKQTNKHTYIHTGKHIDKQRDRQSDRETSKTTKDGNTERQKDKETKRQKYNKTKGQTDLQGNWLIKSLWCCHCTRWISS